MKKYLLDTHIVLWIAENSQMLNEKVRQKILDVNAEKYISIVSAWEVAIKLGTGKLELIGGLPEFFKIADENGFITLPVKREYLLRLKNLDDYHKDPFDRLLISTAVTENMILITADENIHRYDFSWLW